MSFNLLSLAKMVDADIIFVFKEICGKAVIKGTTSTGNMPQIALMIINKDRVKLDCRLAPRSPTAPAAIFTTSISMDVLHRRLGHSGNPAIKRLLAEGMVHGIQVTKGTEVEPCDAYQLGKLTRPPNPPSPFLHNTTKPLQVVVMDLAGPVKPKNLGGR